ncbi:WD40 repeat domain-containing protein [Rhodococcus sp. HM1]|uniref:WD40 repeat domain-containing protein n=1 Tax=unclassified Rhodococcus (in: high G+C Gram-positive bacteria) TaxID=192944 RepID=UPI0034D4EE85
MAFAPDCTLAVPTADGEVELWATAGSSEPTLLSTVGGFDSQAQAVAFTPDGATLAAGSADRSIRLWDVTDRTAPRDRARITGPADAVYSLQFSPSGDRLAAGVGGGAAWLWDVQDAEHPAAYAVLSASGTRVNDATWAHDGEILAGGDRTGWCDCGPPTPRPRRTGCVRTPDPRSQRRSGNGSFLVSPTGIPAPAGDQIRRDENGSAGMLRITNQHKTITSTICGDRRHWYHWT